VNPAAAHDATKDLMEQMENLLKRGIQVGGYVSFGH
jgi:hypothetical protein